MSSDQGMSTHLCDELVASGADVMVLQLEPPSYKNNDGGQQIAENEEAAREIQN